MIPLDVPVYYCLHVNQAVVVDGRLDEDAWRRIPALRLVRTQDGRASSPETVVRACWSDTFFYVSFECQDDDIWGTFTERDADLYDEEVVEIFLSPSGDVRRYYEIELSPHNVVFDAFIENPDLDRRTMVTDRSWTCTGMVTAVRTTATVHREPPRGHRPRDRGASWSAELAIPFAALGLAGPPSSGAEWRVNFYRIDRGRRSAYLAWSPTLKVPADFHVPQRFGTLRFVTAGPETVVAGQWSSERAERWYRGLPWLLGCNFIPSTASNQLEMWQAETFDPVTIDRELGWAAGLGMNVVRVYLHDLAWHKDPAGFRNRVQRFLSIAARHGIRAIFVLFDDCWNPNPQPGPQPAPIPGVHNSRWLQSPGVDVVNDPSQWGRLEPYVRDVLGTFGKDRRVLLWDLYNEPGNSGQGARSLPFLRQVFVWARQMQPAQPLTAGIWANLPELNLFQLLNSDVITFHNYDDASSLRRQIAELRRHGRPLICTEWMARPISTIPSHLAVFCENGVGCFLWGLVAGKTQTIYPWAARSDPHEPGLWFHDLLRPDGTPYDPQEAALLRKLSSRSSK